MASRSRQQVHSAQKTQSLPITIREYPSLLEAGSVLRAAVRFDLARGRQGSVLTTSARLVVTGQAQSLPTLMVWAT